MYSRTYENESNYSLLCVCVHNVHDPKKIIVYRTERIDNDAAATAAAASKMFRDYTLVQSIVDCEFESRLICII